jgi:hypothetical protein
VVWGSPPGPRFWQSYWRNVPYNGTRFIFATVLALLFGSILFNVDHKRWCPTAAAHCLKTPCALALAVPVQEASCCCAVSCWLLLA